MAEDAITEKKGAWTEAEKLGLIFQIIEQSGSIKWDTLTLPEGRTKKACDIMISREKAKVKKAREGVEGGGAGTPSSGKKRKSPVDGDDEETPKKASKPRTPRAKKVKTEEVETEEAAAEDVKEEE